MSTADLLDISDDELHADIEKIIEQFAHINIVMSVV